MLFIRGMVLVHRATGEERREMRLDSSTATVLLRHRWETAYGTGDDDWRQCCCAIAIWSVSWETKKRSKRRNLEGLGTNATSL